MFFLLKKWNANQNEIDYLDIKSNIYIYVYIYIYICIYIYIYIYIYFIYYQLNKIQRQLLYLLHHYQTQF